MQYPATSKYDESGMANPLDPGDYTIRLDEVAASDQNGKKYTDKHGNEYLLFTFIVKDHPANKLFERFCFDEKAPNANVQLGRFKQMIVAMGLDPDKPGDTRDLIGLKCAAYVKQRPWEGKVYNNIASFKPLDIDDVATPAPENSGPNDDDLPF